MRLDRRRQRVCAALPSMCSTRPNGCVFLTECKSESSYCRKGHDKRRNSARNDAEQRHHGGYAKLSNDRYASDERISQSASTAAGRPAANSLTENGPATYTTSLSTDTLYWDEEDEDDEEQDDDPAGDARPASGCASRQHSVKSQSSSTYRRRRRDSGGGFAAVKPVKSWDNLTAKAFGGYGFGYEYLDRDQQMAVSNGGGGQQHMVYLQLKNVKTAGHGCCHGATKNHNNGGYDGHHHGHHHNRDGGHHHNGGGNNVNHQHHHHHHHHHHNRHAHNGCGGRIRRPTKSTEALLSLPPQYPIAAIEPAVASSSSVSCEYLDACSSAAGAGGAGYLVGGCGYDKTDKASQTDCRNRYAQQQQQQAEVTRL